MLWLNPVFFCRNPSLLGLIAEWLKEQALESKKTWVYSFIYCDLDQLFMLSKF